MDTTNKPRKSGGRGKIDPHAGKKFSSTYQPSSQAKKNGILKKKRGHELVKMVAACHFVGMKDSQLKRAASEYFGVPQREITVEMMLVFRQVEKAIQKADTQAFTAIMDRAYGKPKEMKEIKIPKIGKELADETYD